MEKRGELNAINKPSWSEWSLYEFLLKETNLENVYFSKVFMNITAHKVNRECFDRLGLVIRYGELISTLM